MHYTWFIIEHRKQFIIDSHWYRFTKEWLLKTSPPQISRQILQLHAGIFFLTNKKWRILSLIPTFSWLYPFCKWKLSFLLSYSCFILPCIYIVQFFSQSFTLFFLLLLLGISLIPLKNAHLFKKKRIKLGLSHNKLLATSINFKFFSKIFCHTTCTYKQII